MPAKKKVTSVLGVALDLVQIALAVTVIVLTSWKQLNVDVSGLDIDSSCLLDGSGLSDAISGSRFCIFAIVVGVASLLITSIFGCLKTCAKCLTLNACGASKIVSLLGDTLLAIGWTAAFVLFLQRGRAANDLGWPERGSRDGIIAASFGAALAFYADILVTVCVLVL